MDRAFGFGPKGWGFDSLWARGFVCVILLWITQMKPLLRLERNYGHAIVPTEQSEEVP